MAVAYYKRGETTRNQVQTFLAYLTASCLAVDTGKLMRSYSPLYIDQLTLAPATGALTAKPETCRFHALTQLIVFITYDTNCLAARQGGSCTSTYVSELPLTDTAYAGGRLYSSSLPKPGAWLCTSGVSQLRALLGMVHATIDRPAFMQEFER